MIDWFSITVYGGAGFSVGMLLAARSTDAKWLYCANTGIRRMCRGRFYQVERLDEKS